MWKRHRFRQLPDSAMIEVKEDDVELLQLFSKADALVNQANKCAARTERDSLVEKCQTQLKQCKLLISRIEIETRDMPIDDRTQVRQLLKERASKLKELTSELKWARSNNDRFVGQAEEAKYENADEMNEDQLMQYAENIQREDMDILDRVIVDVDETQTVAQNVAVKVAEQTEQIGRIDHKLADVDDELERASRVLKQMLRRIMTDKIIWFVVGLIFICICYIVAKKAGLFD